MIHTCEQMVIGAKDHARGLSYSEGLKYKIYWNDYDRWWELATDWHIQLSHIHFCPFCGYELPTEIAK